MSRPKADEVMLSALKADISAMLEELGNPPLVARIFPNGWENEQIPKLRDLHALFLRTFSSRTNP